MRLFIGIKLNDCQKEIVDIQKGLRQYGINGNYTFPDNIHITLHFLGELNDMNMEIVKDVLNDTSYPVFDVYTE